MFLMYFLIISFEFKIFVIKGNRGPEGRQGKPGPRGPRVGQHYF